jgi:hypothetical protein
MVLSGSFVRPVEARHGDRIAADFGPRHHRPFLRLSAAAFRNSRATTP